jgi:serine/threonine protein kinase
MWGTPMYLPPESWASSLFLILEQAMYGKALDVWSLGITYYEMVYGKLPFGAYRSKEELGQIILNSK